MLFKWFCFISIHESLEGYFDLLHRNQRFTSKAEAFGRIGYISNQRNDWLSNDLMSIYDQKAVSSWISRRMMQNVLIHRDLVLKNLM